MSNGISIVGNVSWRTMLTKQSCTCSILDSTCLSVICTFSLLFKAACLERKDTEYPLHSRKEVEGTKCRRHLKLDGGL